MTLTVVMRFAPELSGVNGQMLIRLKASLLPVKFGRTAYSLNPVKSFFNPTLINLNL